MLPACADERPETEESTSASPPDTLILRTEKVEGRGLYEFGAGSLDFVDTMGLFPYPIVYPDRISAIRGARMVIDLRADDADHIDIITGTQEGLEVFVVDQNDNQDFTDDPVRYLLRAHSKTADNSILCYYQRRVEGTVFRDSSYIKIGRSAQDEDWILYGRNEYLRTEVAVGKDTYQLGAIDWMMAKTFTYGNRAELAIIGTNDKQLDTLPRHDIITTGEFLTLAGEHYRFDSITNDGSYITLVRDPTFAGLVGTQVGMLAPSFVFVTTDGDSLRSAEMQDRPIVVANSCGCGGDTLSGEAFTAIQKTYEEDIYALRLDAGFKRPSPGWNVDTRDPYNEDLYGKYRKAYCSRIAYLVGKDQRIVEKFDVMDWDTALPRHITP
ncbi:hypothetical protein [Lewinella sp. IMCC34191]|uniref:hypothetical protein n=1 Tax=Lewinella sp. IMCC34191 TaxID=2259172 RepID=UPI000E221773|nr:hypothetical protein [Lewinella sp. IMCC34191]